MIAYAAKNQKGYVSFHEDIEIKEMPALIGEVPIGYSDWYKNPANEYLCIRGSDRQDIRPLKGSKRGIACKYGNTRKYEYEYETAEKMGAKFYKWSKKTGKRIFFGSFEEYQDWPSNVKKCVLDSFDSGFFYAASDDKKAPLGEKYIKINFFRGKCLVINTIDLSRHQMLILYEMASELADTLGES